MLTRGNGQLNPVANVIIMSVIFNGGDRPGINSFCWNFVPMVDDLAREKAPVDICIVVFLFN